MRGQQQRRLGGLVVALVAGLLGWWMSTSTADVPGEPAADVGGGMAVTSVEDLPPKAQMTLDRIDSGGPYPYERDGAMFENREEILPDEERGYYQEYTVDTPGSDDRGARRIVTGDDGEIYYTDDHYASFAVVEE